MLNKIVNKRNILASVVIIFTISFGTGGCSENSLTDVEYVQRAKSFQDKGDIKASIIELKNALRKNSNNTEARWLLGNIYIDIGDGVGAEKELRRAGELGIKQDGLIIPLAKSLLMQGKAKQLLSEIKPLDAQSDQSKAQIHALRANAYIVERNIEEAKKSIKVSFQLAPNLVAAQIAQARIFATEGKLEEAINWLDKVLVSTPDSADAWSLMGNIKGLQGNVKDAEEAYSKAIANRSNNVEDYLKRAVVRIYLKDFKGADSDINTLAKQIKGHPELDYAKGYLYINQQKYSEAQAEFDKVLSKTSNDMRAIFYLGVAHARQNHLEQAERYLSQFLNSFPDSIIAAKLLGAVRLSSGNHIGAESVLMPVLERDPNDIEVLNLLGEAMLPQGKPKEAAEYFRRVIAQQSDAASTHLKLGLGLLMDEQYEAGMQSLATAVEADPNLLSADYFTIQGYLKTNELDKAIEAAERLHKKQPDSPHPLTLMAGAYIAKGDEIKARELLQRALQVSPGDPSAASNLARLELGNGEVDAARSLYERVLKHHPAHVDTLVTLAQLDIRQSDIKTGIARLQHAVNENPTASRPRVLLASYYLRAGQPARALSVMQDAPGTDKNPFILGVIGEAQLALNEAENARVTFRKLVDIVPQSARAHYLLGKAYAALNQADKVRMELSEALKIQPNHLPSQIAMTRLLIEENKVDEAKNLLGEMKRTNPDHQEVIALRGLLAMRQGRAKDAIEAFEMAMRIGQSSELTIYLGRAKWESGDQDGSIETFKEWLRNNPSDLGVQYSLASAYLMLNRLEKAKSSFKKVVEQSPNHVLALNNLAWLQRQDDPVKALEYAERALEVAPNAYYVMDTKGMLLLDQGRNVEAVRLLRNASSRAPADLDVRYHLALALSHAGEKTEARHILEKIIAVKRSFENKQSAKSLLKSLGG